MTFAKFPKIHGALMRAIDAYAKDVQRIVIDVQEMTGVVVVTFVRSGYAQSGAISLRLEADEEDRVKQNVGHSIREILARLELASTPKSPGPGAAWHQPARRAP